MNIYLIIILLQFCIILFVLIYNWKNILSMIWKDKFYEIEVVEPSGVVKATLHFYKDATIYKYQDDEYYTLKTSYMKNGHKYYMFIKGIQNHIDLLSNQPTTNEQFSKMRKDIDYINLFKEPVQIIDKILQMAMPFIAGVVLGVLIQMVAVPK